LRTQREIDALVHEVATHDSSTSKPVASNVELPIDTIGEIVRRVMTQLS